ncbi:MAG: 1-acyl-sn-glycerol-3-phosphate acyltransferase [Acidobacteria bacterium]|nr:1-acyl-sn-glycerol-3-phosphate acyltransferase [Acidobacteriota bacterium]
MPISKRTRRMFSVLANGLRPVVTLMMNKSWDGLDRLPRNQGFIVCPNHCTEIDPVVVGHMLYDQNIMPHFLAKDSLFKIPIFGKVMAGAQQIPVSRGGMGAGASLAVAREVLTDNGAIVIYPEGSLTRDPDLWLMKGHTGAARLALETGAPVVPVAHWGAQEVLPRYAKRVRLFPRKTVRVLVGHPVDLSEFKGKPIERELLTVATNRILDAITVLLEELRQEKAPAGHWDPAEHKQSTSGRFDDGGNMTASGAAE